MLEYYMLFSTNPESNTLQTTNCTATCISSHKLFKGDEKDILSTTGEARTNSLINFSYEHNRVGRPAKTYINQLCADTRYRLDDLPRRIVDMYG